MKILLSMRSFWSLLDCICIHPGTVVPVYTACLYVVLIVPCYVAFILLVLIYLCTNLPIIYTMVHNFFTVFLLIPMSLFLVSQIRFILLIFIHTSLLPRANIEIKGFLRASCTCLRLCMLLRYPYIVYLCRNQLTRNWHEGKTTSYPYTTVKPYFRLCRLYIDYIRPITNISPVFWPKYCQQCQGIQFTKAEYWLQRIWKRIIGRGSTQTGITLEGKDRAIELK
jgi:hypothetical protein